MSIRLFFSLVFNMPVPQINWKTVLKGLIFAIIHSWHSKYQMSRR